MTTLLSLEASSDMCSVSLISPKVCQSLESKEPRSHSQLLLPFVDQLLTSCHVDLKQLDFIACSQGPGSFTGLRICFSVAQGLAYGANLPIITVCSLESMAKLSAENLAEKTSPDNCYATIAVLDARMNQVYWGAFIHNEGLLTPLVLPQLQFIPDTRDQIIHTIKQNPAVKFNIVGSGAALVQAEGLDTSSMNVNFDIMPISKMSAKLAIDKWSKGLAVSPDKAKLVYLRDTVSWKKRVKIRPHH